jgi:hypothetical protein
LSKGINDLVWKPAHLKVFLAEHPAVEVDLYKGDIGRTSLLCASYNPVFAASVGMLLDHNAADVNAQSTDGIPSLMYAC